MAVLPVRGLLWERSYRALDAQLLQALTTPWVRAIVLEVNSPGGTTAFCAELAAKPHAASALKPLRAYISGDGAGAAYWLASAAARIDASQTALVGGLGIIWRYLDTRVADERAGVSPIEIVSSDTPKKVPDLRTDPGARQLRRMVDDLTAVMLADVARYRGVSADAVRARYGPGDVLVGKHALLAGLVDGVSTFRDVHAALRGSR